MTADCAELDSWLRNGRVAEVRERLGQIAPSDVPRADLATLGGIARRAGLPGFALKLLHPIVRPVHPLTVPASVAELAVYASCLARIGAFEEAMDIFAGLRAQATPESLLLEAFAQIHQWHYAEAVPCLKKYLAVKGLPEYDAVIGKMNLAACYQFLGTHAKEKDQLLAEIRQACERRGWVRMARNARELSAQSAISKEDFAQAEDLLAGLSRDNAGDELMIEKWRAILAVKKNPADRTPLESVRAKAEREQQLEIVRDCDYYQAIACKDEALAAKVYFGTTAPGYRKRLREATRAWMKLPATYVWPDSKATRVLDMVSGKESGGTSALKPGRVRLKLLRFLASDFYRSFPLGSIFGHLYRGEVFNVDSSPARVRRVIERLREWLKENEIPIAVKPHHGQYRLEFTGSYGLRLPRNLEAADSSGLEQLRLSLLRSKFTFHEFSARQAAEALEMPLENTRKFLQDATARKRMRCTGRGRSTRFRFSK